MAPADCRPAATSHCLLVPEAPVLRRLRAERSAWRDRGVRGVADPGHRPAGAPHRHVAPARRRHASLALPIARCAADRTRGMVRRRPPLRAARRAVDVPRRRCRSRNSRPWRSSGQADARTGDRQCRDGRYPQPRRRTSCACADGNTGLGPVAEPMTDRRHGGGVLRHRLRFARAIASRPTTASTLIARPIQASCTPGRNAASRGCTHLIAQERLAVITNAAMLAGGARRHAVGDRRRRGRRFPGRQAGPRR